MQKHLRGWSWALCLVVIIGSLGACTNDGATSNPTEEATPIEEAAPSGISSLETEDPAPEVAVNGTFPGDLPVLQGTATVELRVNGGSVVIEVDGEKAPVTAGNFVDLVQRGVYDGVLFHRVVKSPQPFVVQGGDPLSKDPSTPVSRLGTGSFVDPETQQPRLIPLEIQPADADQPVYSQTFETAGVTQSPALSHTRGAVAMARSQFPDSASSQFYIALTDLPFLDGNYAVFGYVTAGMDVVDAIEQGDIIDSATVTAGGDNLVD